MSTTNTGHVMTVANSIIGVGILAMPFCFQKCGIVLSIVLLIMNSIITRISCNYLIKAAILTRRKSFEFLAFHAFGSSGKLMVELCIIGYLIGTCIAYFVVIGDLGPQILAKVLNTVESDKLRTWVMIIVTFLCVIPLAMLKNVDSLAAVCTASIGFYLCLVIKVIGESQDNFFSNDWIQHVEYWKPSGTLQCLPIFSMALSCQMQLFEVFEAVPNASVEKMNKIVKSATMICMWVYVFVGFFGYVAFCTQPFGGNILVKFSPSLASDVIKMGFVLSVAFSFPLVIFPCRASIYSLLYRRGHSDNTSFMPELRFKTITISVALFSLSIALLIPSIELVIGLVGSTIGVAICIMFPASCFMTVVKKDSNERHRAQFILIGGFCLMILGTYANLLAIDEKHSGPSLPVPELKDAIEHPAIVENFKILPKPIVSQVAEKPIALDLPKVLKDDESANVEAKVINKESLSEGLKSKATKVETVVIPESKPKEEINKKADDKPIRQKQNNVEINKDAIKKDEDIAAEEKPKYSNLDVKRAENELQEAKVLLEKKVNELEKQLKKQNEETRNLVAEKLGDIVEKVEEIEKDLKESQLQPKIENKKAENDIEKNDIEQPRAVKKTPNRILPSAPKGSLINMLTDNIKERQKISEVKATAFEPLSYKTGELVNKLQKTKKINETKSPLPLPLLINASISKLTEANGKSNTTINPTKLMKEIMPQNNIESMRREILQANANTESAHSENNTRIKRNAAQDNCRTWNEALEECLDDSSVQSKPLQNAVNLETESIGRELKSIKNIS